MKARYIQILFLIFIVSGFVYPAQAQITIGMSKAPNPSALLDLTDNISNISTKGLLLPRVRLSTIVQPTPQSEHVRGMLVYNLTDDADIKEDAYINSGFGWYPLYNLPTGTAAGDYLSFNNAGSLIWRTITVPQPIPGVYTLKSSKALNREQIYVIDRDEVESPWFTFGDTLSVMSYHTQNKLIVTVQVLMNKQYDNSATDGWLSYSGGIFASTDQQNPIDYRDGTLIYQALNDNDVTYSLVTLHFVLENIPVGENKYTIRFKRNDSYNFKGLLQIGYDQRLGDDGLNLFNTASSVSSQYYEDKSTI